MATPRRPDSPFLRLVPDAGDPPPEPDADHRERVFRCGTDAELPGWRYVPVGGGFRGRLLVRKELPLSMRTRAADAPHRLSNPGSY